MEKRPDTSRLEAAVAAGHALGKVALYFGCWDVPGHYLHLPNGRSVYRPAPEMVGLPWSDGLMDGGLLANGKRPDVCDGKVFWTCGGSAFWYAFYWWDRSGDRRGASNSGFYVRGFGWPEAQAAFDYACAAFPKIVARQRHPLVLQSPKPQPQNDENPQAPKEPTGQSRSDRA